MRRVLLLVSSARIVVKFDKLILLKWSSLPAQLQVQSVGAFILCFVSMVAFFFSQKMNEHCDGIVQSQFGVSMRRDVPQPTMEFLSHMFTLLRWTILS